MMEIEAKNEINIIEQIKEKKQEIKFSTREYVTEYLVNKFKEDEFYIPLDYQRNFVWKEKDSSFFVESVLIGLPIPYMFFADAEDGRTEVVDGAQRMNALASFVKDELRLQDLEILTSVNGMVFSELPVEIRRRFLNFSFRVVYLEEGTTVEVRQEIFRRINSSGMRLKAQEIRRGAMDGPFKTMIDGLAKNELFVRLAPLAENAKKHFDDLELITRFFAYSDGYPEFEGYGDRVARYLDDYTEKMNHLLNESPELIDSYEKRFINMLTFIQECLGDRGFRKTINSNSTPHARFEALSVGVAIAQKNADNCKISRDMSWVDEDDFQKLVRSDSANVKAKLKGRISFVVDRLLNGDKK